MSNQQEFNFTLSLDDVNLILSGLGTMPYQQVFQVINKIQVQAQAQLNGDSPAPQAVAIEADKE